MALFHDAQRARRNRRVANARAAGWLVVHRLNKDGTPSGMHGSESLHADTPAAFAYINRVRALNADNTLRFSIDGTEV